MNNETKKINRRAPTLSYYVQFRGVGSKSKVGGPSAWWPSKALL